MGRFPVRRSAGNCNRAPRRSTRAAPRPAQEWEPAGSLRPGRAWCCWRRVRGGSCAPGTTAQVLLVRTAAVALPGTAADPPVTTTAALLAGTARAPWRVCVSGWRMRAGDPLGEWTTCAGAPDRRAGLVITAGCTRYGRGARRLLPRPALVTAATRARREAARHVGQ